MNGRRVSAALALGAIVCTFIAYSGTQDDVADHPVHQSSPLQNTEAVQNPQSESTLRNSLITRLDTNKDGMLSVSEVMGDATLLELFAKLDANGDGYISRQELDDFRHHVSRNTR